MPYAQFDDLYDDHRKTKRAWRKMSAAVGLHAMAICHCNRHKTDGLVDAEWVDEKLALSSLKPREQQAMLDTLLECGMFERDGDDYRVHDFLDWNRSRAQRQALADQGRRGGHARAVAQAKPPDDDGSSPGSSHGYSDGQAQAKPPDDDGSSPGSSHGYSDGQAPAKPSSSDGSSTPRHATPTPRQSSNSNAELRSAALDAFAYWQQQCGHPQAQYGADRRRLAEARLLERKRHHGGDLNAAAGDLRRAIDGAARAAFVDERGKRHDSFELICRNNSKLEDFMGRADLPAAVPSLRVVGGRQSAGDLIDQLRAAEEAS